MLSHSVPTGAAGDAARPGRPWGGRRGRRAWRCFFRRSSTRSTARAGSLFRRRSAPPLPASLTPASSCSRSVNSRGPRRQRHRPHGRIIRPHRRAARILRGARRHLHHLRRRAAAAVRQRGPHHAAAGILRACRDRAEMGAAFVGSGKTFQIWEPARFELHQQERRARARGVTLPLPAPAQAPK